MFKTGEKVVCINPIDGLVKNEIYTIKQIIEQDSKIAVILLEYDTTNIFVAYFSYRFRKLDYEFVKEVCNMIEEDNLVKVDK